MERDNGNNKDSQPPSLTVSPMKPRGSGTSSNSGGSNSSSSGSGSSGSGVGGTSGGPPSISRSGCFCCNDAMIATGCGVVDGAAAAGLGTVLPQS